MSIKGAKGKAMKSGNIIWSFFNFLFVKNMEIFLKKHLNEKFP